jgi:hypothetical protein
MELSPPWDVASRLATEQFAKILWNPKKIVIKRSQYFPLLPTTGQIKPVNIT